MKGTFESWQKGIAGKGEWTISNIGAAIEGLQSDEARVEISKLYYQCIKPVIETSLPSRQGSRSAPTDFSTLAKSINDFLDQFEYSAERFWMNAIRESKKGGGKEELDFVVNIINNMRVCADPVSYFQVLDKNKGDVQDRRVDPDSLNAGNALSVCNTFFRNVSKYSELLANSDYRNSYFSVFQEFPITVEAISLCRAVGATPRQ